MKKSIIHLTLLSLIIIYSNNLKAGTDSTYNNICKTTSYLPINKPRISSNCKITSNPEHNLLVYNAGGYLLGISVYDGIKWSYWDKSSGLNSNNIYSIFIDREGNTWVGTDSGVCVFDGKAWKNYAIPNNYGIAISSICEDKKSNMWFFTNNSNCYMIKNNLLQFQSLPFYLNYVNSTTISNDSSMWLASNGNGIYKFDGANWTNYTTSNGLFTNSVQFINCVHDSIFCLYNYPAWDSISKFDGKKWIKFPNPENNSSPIQSIYEDYNKDIWALIGNDIYRYTYNSWAKLNLNDYINNYNWPSSLGTDKDSNIYIVNSYAEPKVVKFSNGDFTLLSNNLYKGIAMVDPSMPMVDKKNNLWVKSSSGMNVSKFDGKTWINTPYDSMIYIWNSNSLSNFVQDSIGNIYIGGYGISKFDGNKWTAYGSNLFYKYGKSYTYAYDLLMDYKNDLWFYCSYPYQVIVRLSSTGFTEFNNQDSLHLDYYPSKIFQDKDSNIWITYYNQPKASKYDGNKWTTVSIPLSYVSDAIVDLIGNVWFCGGNKLVRYNKLNGYTTYTSFNSKILDQNIGYMAVDKKGRLIFTYSNYSKIGIYNNSTFTNIDLGTTSYNGATGIVIDTNNVVYVCTQYSGLIKVNFNLDTPTISKTDIDCVGEDNGSIILHPKDNGYLYSIDNGLHYQVDTVYSNLLKGNYSIITKSNKCYSPATQVTIKQPTGSFDVITSNSTCNGRKDGYIKILTLGLDSIKYLWSNGADSSFVDSLAKGTYSVKINYANNCKFVKNYVINEPDSLIVSSNIFNNCGNFKGKINLNITGGTPPYIIKWSTNDTTKDLNNLSAGDYKVSIKDVANCKALDSIYTIKLFDKIKRDKIIGLNKKYLCSDSVMITPKNNFIAYKWYKNNRVLDTVNKIYASNPGTYSVEVIDSNFCVGTDSINIIAKRNYSVPQLCLVTVDSLTDKNELVWNKINADSLAVIHVLKETQQSNIYKELINFQAYHNGIFEDSSSNPDAKSDRYKLYLTDECFINSDTGIAHKTIHLTSNIGTHGEVNLIWSGYEGFNFNSYNLYRGTNNINMELLTSIQSDLDSYTDLNPPQDGQIYYQLEVIDPNNCSPNSLKVSEYNSTKSNIIKNLFTNIESKTAYIKVTPNPIDNYFNITINNMISSSYILKITGPFRKISFK